MFVLEQKGLSETLLCQNSGILLVCCMAINDQRQSKRTSKPGPTILQTPELVAMKYPIVHVNCQGWLNMYFNCLAYTQKSSCFSSDCAVSGSLGQALRSITYLTLPFAGYLPAGAKPLLSRAVAPRTATCLQRPALLPNPSAYGEQSATQSTCQGKQSK